MQKWETVQLVGGQNRAVSGELPSREIDEQGENRGIKHYWF
jgi:hypothetical protein